MTNVVNLLEPEPELTAENVGAFLAQARELLLHDTPVADFDPLDVTRLVTLIDEAAAKYGPAADWAVYMVIEAAARFLLNPDEEPYGAGGFFADVDFTYLGLLPKLPATATPMSGGCASWR